MWLVPRGCVSVAPEMTAQGVVGLKLVLGGGDVSGAWVDGVADDVLLSTKLVDGAVSRGAGAMHNYA